MSRIYLIRHGKTEANERHLYCGSSDLPLSEAGVDELIGLRDLYGEVRAEAFYTSGMRRTDETLRILFGKAVQGFTKQPAFREIDFGDFELKSYEELKDEPAYQEWISGDNDAKTAPAGESGRQMRARALSAFSELRTKDEDAVLVTHGGVIAAIMSHLFPETDKNLYAWQPQCGHGYVIGEGWYMMLP